MKRFWPFLVLALAATAPVTFGQGTYSTDTGGDHAEVGVFGTFFRLNDADANFEGLGGRASVNANPYIQLEAEMSYDFKQSFTETYRSTGGSTTTTSVVNSNLHVLDGLFGPKVQTNKGPVRLFLTAKGGFVNFMFNPTPTGFSGFTSSVSNLRSNNVDGVFYPGVGGEAYLGPIGLRLDVGDEIYFANGAHNNLRISFGPTIRF